MPRGNDAEAAQHDLADRFGRGTGNAEELIQANASRYSRELTTLNLLPVDAEATAELDIGSLEGPDGEPVLAAAVRGSGRTSGTVVIYEDEEGRSHKVVQDFDDGSSKRQQKKSREGEGSQKQNARSQSREGEASDKAK
jgi:hypothetical protein